MSAACYLCELNYDTITGQSRGDAVGTCKLCGVLACLAHGMRNPNRPAYVCGCCVPNLLAAAAVRILGQGDSSVPRSPISPSAPGDHDALPDPPSGFSEWALTIGAVDDVIGDLADDHWAWLHEDIAYLSKFLAAGDAPTALRAFAHPDAEPARVLMAAAVAIATKLNLPAHEMSPALQPVAQLVQLNA